MKLQMMGVTKHYPEVTAVRDLSFGVEEGEFLTLLGPSGSGKSTTLMLIAGFIAPDDGQVYLNGNDVTNLPEFKRNIGVVFQNYALFPHMTVERNVAFPLRMRGRSQAEIEAKVLRALKLVGLTQHNNRYPRQLSGGQQQRVALARALVFDPPVLLMDEPLGSLDRKLREQMQVEFKRIQRELNVTVVYVTHDQEEALAMSDRIALMNHGRIEQIGTASDLYERPASRFVADFVGEANFLDGKITENDPQNGVAIDIGRGQVIKSRSGFAAGSPVTLAVRPERIEITTERTSPGLEPSHRLENRLWGIMIDEVYTGATVKYTVALDGDIGIFLVRHQKPRGEGSHPHISRGNRVVLDWRAEDTIVIPFEAVDLTEQPAQTP